MKQLRRICAGLILTLALSLSAFGGVIHNPPPTGPQESPGVAGDTQFPGVAGDVQFPGVAGLGFLFALLFS